MPNNLSMKLMPETSHETSLQSPEPSQVDAAEVLHTAGIAPAAALPSSDNLDKDSDHLVNSPKPASSDDKPSTESGPGIGVKFAKILDYVFRPYDPVDSTQESLDNRSETESWTAASNVNKHDEKKDEDHKEEQDDTKEQSDTKAQDESACAIHIPAPSTEPDACVANIDASKVQDWCGHGLAESAKAEESGHSSDAEESDDSEMASVMPHGLPKSGVELGTTVEP